MQMQAKLVEPRPGMLARGPQKRTAAEADRNPATATARSSKNSAKTNGSGDHVQPVIAAASSSLDELMRAAIIAAGCKDEAAFRKLPATEQNDFLAQARGLKSVPNRDGVKLYDPATIRRSPFNREVDESDPEFIKIRESVREDGVLQNGILRPVHPPVGKVAWELIIGEHRWLAALRTGKEFPATVRSVDDTKAIELQAIENFRRKQLNAIEEARKYQQLIERYVAAGLGRVAAVEKIHETLSSDGNKGRSIALIYERLTLLELPDKARDLVRAGRLPASHAALLTPKKIHDPRTVESLAATIANKEGKAPIPYREAERLVDDAAANEKRLEEWQNLRNEYQARGWQILTEAENKKTFPWSGSTQLSNDAAFIKAGEERCFATGGYKTWTKAMGKHAPSPALARASDGTPVIVYQRAAAMAAVDKNTPRNSNTRSSSPGQSKERAEQAKKRDTAKMRRSAWTAILNALVAAVERAGDSETFLRVVADKLIYRIISSGERAKLVVDRRGLRKDNVQNNDTILSDRVKGGFNGKQLRGMIIEALAWDFVPCDFGAERSWQSGLVELCAQWGVDPREISKQLHPSGNADMAKPKKRGSRISPEQRARIAALQRARWVKGRKGI